MLVRFVLPLTSNSIFTNSSSDASSSPFVGAPGVHWAASWFSASGADKLSSAF